MYDVAIIGGGVIGCALAERLSRLQLNVAVIERAADVADGTTKANSGIVHAGYDAPGGTLMARLNLEGSQLMPSECERLDVPYQQVGSYVLAFGPDDDAHLRKLRERGLKNGVEGLEIITGEMLREREPAISKEVSTALYAPTGAIVDPFRLCVAYAEIAACNGVDFLLEHEVLDLREAEESWRIQTSQGSVEAAWVVNAAGAHADEIQAMAGEREFTITPVRGEYYMMDKDLGDLVHSVIFQCPGPKGKGVLVSPTVHGNLIVGPNAETTPGRDDVQTTQSGQEAVRKKAVQSVPGLDWRSAIRNFAGIRANSDAGDFIVRMSKSAPRFLNLAGICSPGLSASPAIARMGAEILQEAGLPAKSRDKAAASRKVIRVKDLDRRELQKLVQNDPLYGRVICRCETITEGEIRDALHSPLPAKTVDGLKRRCGNGMGRCQGSFCLPRVMHIMSRELSLPQQQIRKDGPGSHILRGGSV